MKGLILISVTIAFGCNLFEPVTNENIRIIPDKSRYLNGETMALYLENPSGHSRRLVGITTCTVGLQQQINLQWQNVPLVPDLDCSRVRIGTTQLQPGEVDTAQFTLKVDEDQLAQPFSIFRLAARALKDNGEPETVFSGTFQIESGPVLGSTF